MVHLPALVSNEKVKKK